MKIAYTRKSVSGIAALLLLAVFAAGILSVLLTGADLYRRISDRSTDGYDRRTCVQYLSGKVRQSASPRGVSVTEFGEEDCLVFSEWIDGEEYETKIYCFDGWLMELFSAADSGLEPQDGSKILPLADFSAACSEGLLTLTLTDLAGETDTVFLSLRGGKAGSL